MTTAAGGVSKGLFASMNLADHVGDESAAVADNRVRLARSLGPRPVFMRQVHGTTVAQLSDSSEDGLEADGAVSTQPGRTCVVMVADCLPILLTHARLPVVAALHAGWRGLAGKGGRGIVEAGWQALRRQTDAPEAELASGLMAWLGPCIGPRAFEVGAEVRQAFVQGQPQAAGCFAPLGRGKFLADLPALARLRLARLGISEVFGNDASDAWCTVSQSRFFSHRRVSGRIGARPGDTGGRMAACIALT
jgi:YfiH family protein